MFVISHNNHVVSHNSLLLPVIKRSIGGRYIVIHGQHKSLIAAGNRHFPDELHIMWSCLRLKALKIQVESVKAIGIRLIHQFFNELFPGTGGGHQSLCIKVLDTFLGAHILHHGPHLQSHVMGLIHVILTG